MIAPVRQSPPRRPRRSALHEARLAVADALLERRASQRRPSRYLASWRVWLTVCLLAAIAAVYLITLDWWTLKPY